MNLLAISCSYRNAPVAVRERVAFTTEQLDRALGQLAGQLGLEAVILSTCNRVEVYVHGERDVSGFLSEFHGIPWDELRPHLEVYQQQDVVRHLFRVAASLDSLVIGEGQIAGQVKTAYDRALSQGSTGPLLNALFPHARQVAKRVRTETGISQGRVSVSSAAVDYVKEVFDHFGDKTILVIGAGKMGELTLKALRNLQPRRVLVTNRSWEKALTVAAGCKGEAVPWEKLDDALVRADIVLSTTGSPEVIVSRERYARVEARRTRWPVVILDIAVPRDFDPRIHDGDRTCLFNIDDLKTLREATLAKRREHIVPAEHIVEAEAARFLKDWARRGNGPVIACLTREFETRRQEIVRNLLTRLNGKLDDADRQYIDKAFRLYQNQMLHGPISALSEASGTAGSQTLREALRKLFRLPE